MVIGREHAQALIRYAREGFPDEVCGLLATLDGSVVHVYPVRNADESPVHYRMEPQEQLHAMLEIDDQGWELGAIYHSHTRTRAYPSATDVGLAFYPDTLQVIISLAGNDPEIRAFSIRDGNIREERLEIGAAPV